MASNEAAPADGEGGAQILVARCGEKRFAVPLGDVQEVFELTEEPVVVPGAAQWLPGIINHHGQVVLLLSAAALFDLPGGPNCRQVVLLRLAGDLVGLVVEHIEGVEAAGAEEATSSAASSWPRQLLDSDALRRAIENRLAKIDASSTA